MKMKQVTALLLALMLVLSLAACANQTGQASESPASSETNAPAEQAGIEESGILSEAEAAAARDAGTLQPDALAGYDYSDSTATWYYSNYPNYKDFKADGVVKVAFVCKFSGAWFTPKAESLGETVKGAGYEYLYIDANSDEQAWLDGVQNIINQDFDVVVLTPVNTALLADAVAMLQEAGIAYMTTDDPGADINGFYVPHYGLDDYFLYHELGKAAAQKMADENFFDGVADDYSNFRFVIMDSPSVEAIHKRSQAYCDAILEAFPDIPEGQILWLDCGAGLTDDILDKLGSTLQTYIGSTDKWLLASGTGSAFTPSITLLRENGIDLKNVIFSETCADSTVIDPMPHDPEVGQCSVLCGLVSAPSGVGMGKIIIDLVENSTPIPCFTGYDLIVVDQNTVADFASTYFGY